MEIVKCYLHISPEEQRARLLARLDDPTKQWKYNPGDLATRERWIEYIEAYERAMARSSTEAAPWHIIPADRKWYRNWAVSAILIERLEAMGLDWPKPDYDVEAERDQAAGDALADRAQAPDRPAAERAHDALEHGLALALAAVGDGVDDPPLALDQLDHRLVDRLRGQQVPGGDGVVLADPVAAVLGLVVHRRASTRGRGRRRWRRA